MQHLHDLEDARGLRVLHAGDPSLLLLGNPNRLENNRSQFVFVRSIDHYLSLFPQDGDIELADCDPLDISGQDIKSVIIQCLQGNTTYLDLLRTPIAQLKIGSFAEQLVDFALENGDPVRFASWHLKRLTRQRRRFDGGAKAEIVPERLIELLRPALSLRWYSQNRLTGLPPATLPQLLEDVFLRPVLRGEIDELLQRQSEGNLRDLMKIPSAIADLVLAEIEAGPAIETRRKRTMTRTELGNADRFFLKWAVAK
ncbi:DNA polymerase beta superfamily protein [Polycladidibacter hongkongensis]|uniref:DNA polymerase beta superfamily protein n=1 Tax=Polycladidibacter hongkongensis TaxID=1647556 RepID=UPI00082DD621|nr:nucleotidyltransferase domain-containing protein [Pseudovibrio hongkongensis]